MILTLAACVTLDPLFFGGSTTDAYALDAEIVPEEAIRFETFRTDDDLELWGVWALQDDPDADVVIYFHGRSANLDEHFVHRVEPLWSLGYSVFAFDYRGYGRSEGEQEGAGILELDGQAAVDHVVATTGRAPEDLYWYGLSLGGAVVAHTTDERPARAIVMESTFASADHMLDTSTLLDLPPGWFVDTAADNVEAIRAAQSPVFIVHGLADDFVDPSSAALLFDAAPEPKSLWTPAGIDHSNLAERLPDAFAERIPAFYEAH
jgi:hypothetical protein